MDKPRGNLLVPTGGLEFINWVDQSYMKSDLIGEQVTVGRTRCPFVFGNVNGGY